MSNTTSKSKKIEKTQIDMELSLSGAALPSHAQVNPKNQIKVQSTTPSIWEDVAHVYGYLREKFIDGLCLGVAFSLLTVIDTYGHFTKFVDELLTQLHPAVALLGYASAYCYILWRTGKRVVEADKPDFFIRICKSWFDLVQQFFTLAAGAFVPIKFFQAFYSNHLPSLKTEIGPYSAIILGAVFFGSLWSLKDSSTNVKVRPSLRALAYFAIFLGLMLTLASFKTLDGGYQFLKDAFQQVLTMIR